MNNLMDMKRIYNFFHHQMEEGTFDKEEAQAVFDRLEQLFYACVRQNEVEFTRKDDMFIVLENNAKQRLQLLEEKVHRGSNIANIQEQTSRLSNIIKEFWHQTGFHYVKSFRMNEHGTAELELGFSLDYGTMSSDKPVTAKEEKQKTKERLQEEGFLLNEKGTKLLDCDRNKENIAQLLLQRFSSASIFSWETFIDNHKTKEHSLRSMKVRISKIEDIINIKTPQ